MKTTRESESGKKRATLADVARRAGVSPMTVSRVVRDTKQVKGETRKRILGVIREMGYRPDPVLSALSAYRTAGGGRGDGSTIAFLDCDGSAYSQGVLEGAREEARLFGYQIESHGLPESEKARGRLLRVFYHQGVRGLLVGPSDHESDFHKWPWEHFAAVSLGALVHQPAMHAVAMDYFQGSYSACRILIERGCRRIAFAVQPESESRTGHRWLGGYQSGIGTQAPILFANRRDRNEGFAAWCERKGVDGVLTIHQELVPEWRGERSGMVLLNDSAMTDSPELSSLTHLSLDRAKIGAEGVRALHHYLLRQEYGIPEISKLTLLQGRWRHKNRIPQ